MASHLPLSGIRIHLSGSLPEDGQDRIPEFVEKFTSAVLSGGGTLIHGSHPGFIAPLKKAAEGFIRNAGSQDRDALTLVRAHKFGGEEYKAEIAAHRQFAAVEIIPGQPGSPMKELLPMRQWMAERCDVIVALGGKWSGAMARAGVPVELEEALARGKPGFALGGFGGALRKYLDNETSNVLPRLRNGLSPEENRKLADSTDVDSMVNTIVAQIQRLPVGAVRNSSALRLLTDQISSGDAPPPASQEVEKREGAGPGGRMFRILALDGGGIRGAFTAAVLATWAKGVGDGSGADLIKHFDLVAGTSTGSILAIGLGLGITPEKMLDFYRVDGPKLFSGTAPLRHWFKSKYESTTLEECLSNRFGADKLLNDSLCRLVIPTVEANNGKAVTFTTPHSRSRKVNHPMNAVEAALASAAAPSYFSEANVEGPVAVQTYLDGGVWANNPAAAAIAEAVGHLNIPLDRVDVLSIGTLGCEADFDDALDAGKLKWAASISNLCFAAQESGTVALTNSLLGLSHHLRVDHPAKEAIALDNVKALAELVRYGQSVGRDTFAAVQSRFLNGFHVRDWKKSIE